MEPERAALPEVERSPAGDATAAETDSDEPAAEVGGTAADGFGRAARPSVARLHRTVQAARIGGAALRATGLGEVAARFILFTPFDSPPFRALDRRLGKLPLGAQYYVTGRVPS